MRTAIQQPPTCVWQKCSRTSYFGHQGPEMEYSQLIQSDSQMQLIYGELLTKNEQQCKIKLRNSASKFLFGLIRIVIRIAQIYN